jgi:hypothetical protein
MNLNDLQNIGEIIEQAQKFITQESGKLPKEEQAKLQELQNWSKNKTAEELEKKMLELRTENKK